MNASEKRRELNRVRINTHNKFGTTKKPFPHIVAEWFAEPIKPISDMVNKYQLNKIYRDDKI
jgi:hypothetical protein